MNIEKIITISLFVISSICSCTQNTTQNKTKEETVAILKANTVNESKAFYKKDSAAWSKFFVHNENVYWVCVEDNVTLRAIGWNDLSNFLGSWMRENSTPEADSIGNKTTIEDFNVDLNDGFAFVHFKKNQRMADGITKVLLENRIFKMENNEWKILSMTSAPGYNTKKSTKNIFIHNDK